MMRLCEKLVSLRKEKGLAQMEVAEQLGISRQAISRWEVGASLPSTDNLRKLSLLYGIPFDYLMNDTVEEKPSADAEEMEEVVETVPVEKPMEQEKITLSGKFVIQQRIVLVLLILMAVALGICVWMLTEDLRGANVISISDIEGVEVEVDQWFDFKKE